MAKITRRRLLGGSRKNRRTARRQVRRKHRRTRRHSRRVGRRVSRRHGRRHSRRHRQRGGTSDVVTGPGGTGDTSGDVVTDPIITPGPWTDPTLGPGVGQPISPSTSFPGYAPLKKMTPEAHSKATALLNEYCPPILRYDGYTVTSPAAGAAGPPPGSPIGDITAE